MSCKNEHCKCENCTCDPWECTAENQCGCDDEDLVAAIQRKDEVAEYISEEPCEFIYNITAIEKVVDGDTLDAVIDLGFDVRFCGRIRLL